MVLSSLSAPEASTRYFELKPSNDTEAIFKKVEFYQEGKDNYQVKIYGSKDNVGIIESYHVTIDLENKKYKATKNIGEKLYSILNKTEKQLEIPVSTFSTQTTGSYSGGVIATTDDPLGVDVCQSKHKLWWSVNSNNLSSYVNREASAWAANPSLFNTHWYILDNYYTGLNTIDGGRTVTSSSFHSYYNYDFGDTNQRTDVSHELTIYGYYTGNYDYFVDWSASGEYSGLLDLDITTY